jgi:hypothetical protein
MPAIVNYYLSRFDLDKGTKSVTWQRLTLLRQRHETCEWKAYIEATLFWSTCEVATVTRDSVNRSARCLQSFILESIRNYKRN